MPAVLRPKGYLCLSIVTFIISLIFAAIPAMATTYSWSASWAINDSWEEDLNWRPSPPVGGPDSGDDVIFEDSANVTLGNSHLVNSVTAEHRLHIYGESLETSNLTLTHVDTSIGARTAGKGYIVTNQFKFDGAALRIWGPGFFDIRGSNNIIHSFPIELVDAQLFLNGDQNIILRTDVANDASGINLSNSALLSISQTAGAISYQGVINGSGSLRKRSAGFLTLSGSNTYNGYTEVEAGTLIATGGGNQLPSTTNLIVSGGTTCELDDQTVAGISGTGTIDIQNDGTLTVNETGNNTFNGNIDDSGGNGIFEKAGSGTLTLTGTLQPEVRVASGTLVMNGTANDSVKVFGGTLLGTGTVGMLQLNGGVFSPGNSIGTLSAAVGIVWYSGGHFNVEVSGGAADQMDVTGAVSLDNPALSVTGVPTTGSLFTIINNDAADAVTGTFSGLAEGATFVSGGYQYQITYIGGDGNDVVLTSLGVAPTPPAPTPDPEPEPDPDPDPEPTPNAPPAPDVPPSGGGNPSPTGSGNGPSLNWPETRGARQYRVYRSSCPTCPKEEVGRVADNSFTDESALPGQVYYYYVRAENGGGLSGYSGWMAAWRYEQNPGRGDDFNGDGVMDLLWWDPNTNQITIWFMNGGSVQSVSAPLDGLDISNWLLVNACDFNSDGICDILWWNPETGEALIWYMGSTQSAASDGFSLSSSAAGDITGSVTLSYSGDLNGDGRSDLLWRDYNTGVLSIWLMGEDGKALEVGPPMLADGMTDGGKPGISDSLEWTIRGLYDMNSDGKADVVWQHAFDGRVVVWLMEGGQAVALSEYQRSEPENWRVAGLGDLNGDRLGDLVWRNDLTGAIQVWLMTGGDPAYEERDIPVGDDAENWQVKAVGDFRVVGVDDVYCLHPEDRMARIVTLDGEQYQPSVE
jgi:autotransporter-associated beta strand protein